MDDIKEFHQELLAMVFHAAEKHGPEFQGSLSGPMERLGKRFRSNGLSSVALIRKSAKKRGDTEMLAQCEEAERVTFAAFPLPEPPPA